ncbi:MmcQ/YjbR family DNA-binding protein [Microbacterium sp. SD291]|uniref:MmcQ/YjbR family DNA-binding protein n=1 Tax=Microbacterium sp. SD291 TaxID=2782007 RepID=UPI001A97C646|nr:MmcQ/YjbR family DNA-binding protein [Microbacterium sp. SD291]MBO0982089.1 MmcQ/YjbR family DNA-binding protein [Microbacterium sp. SD291]
MATVDDVRELALALPWVEEATGGHTGAAAWRVKSGQFAWLRGPTGSDLRQLAELGRQWPEGPVLGVRVGSLEEKEALLAAEPGWLFTIPHFDGYPALLVELDAIDRDRLAEIIDDAWLLRAPARVAKTWLADRGLE